MDSVIEGAALLVLLRCEERRRRHLVRRVAEAGSATAVLAEEDGVQFSLLAADELASTVERIRRWRAQGIELVTVLDRNYPYNLRTIDDPPPFLFYRGRLEPEVKTAIAVVGARAASASGIELARRITSELVAAAFTVVSGLAAGIDTAVHRQAIRAGGRTLAVIGTGLEHAYPPQNEGLQREIARRHTVVSQFLPHEPPSRRTFPQRNGVMSGLTSATVVVEASARSGARLQARLALAQGRRVFIPRSLLDQEWARSCAAQAGAEVFDQPQEIVAAMSSSEAAVA